VQTRQLGATDLQLTTIGLGTWAIGGGAWKFGWGHQDEATAIAAIVRGVELGINWIDTAAVYGDGRSEELVGRALQQIDRSRRPLVATKCGRIFRPNGEIFGRLKRSSLLAECEASLRRLQLETIDLYQIHWPDPDEDIEEAWETLADLVRQGKVRCIGVSNFSVSQLRRLQAIHPPASLQPPYNMLDRKIEDQLLDFCGEHQIGIVAYSPMAKGLLTGAFDRQRVASLPANDHRSRDPKFQQPLLEINLQLVEALAPIAARSQRSVAELAIAWVLRRPEVTSAIVGVRRPQQIEATLSATDWQLTVEDQQQIQQALERRQQALRELGPLDTGRV
jgi:aryl-alcohol dehydrogenase-like predicted oxidoreductase